MGDSSGCAPAGKAGQACLYESAGSVSVVARPAGPDLPANSAPAVGKWQFCRWGSRPEAVPGVVSTGRDQTGGGAVCDGWAEVLSGRPGAGQADTGGCGAGQRPRFAAGRGRRQARGLGVAGAGLVGAGRVQPNAGRNIP